MIDYMNHRTPHIFLFYLLLLFPGYFFYHIAHSMGYTPYVGWFGILVIAGVFLFVINTYIKILFRQQDVNLVALPITLPVILLFSIMIIATALNHLQRAYDYINTEGLIWNVTNILLMLGFYLISKRLCIKSKSSFTLLMIVIYIFYSVFTYYFYSSVNHTIILPNDMAADKSNVASYQSMAMCILYTMLILCPFVAGKVVKTLLFLSSICLLYFVGARTEFFLACAVIPFFLYINYGLKVVVGMLVVSVMVTPFAFMAFEVNDRFSSTISELLSGGARNELLKKGVQGIIDSPFAGDYLGQIRDYGTPGAYIHNALSMYQQYGVVAFIIYMYLTFVSLVVGVGYIKFAKNHVQFEVLVYTSITSFIGVILAKSIGWPLPAFAWGMCCVVLVCMARMMRIRREEISR